MVVVLFLSAFLINHSYFYDLLTSACRSDLKSGVTYIQKFLALL